MSKLPTLNSKIVLMLLASVAMVLLLVGGIFSFLVTNLHQSSAEAELARGLELLQIELQSKKERLIETRKRMLLDPSILASVNLIWKYQQIDDYQPLLFNPEKEALVRIVQEEVQGTELSFVAIYTAEGEVISFYDARSDIAGYLSYQDSSPVVLQYQHQGGEAITLGDIPLFLNGLDMEVTPPDHEIHFRMNAGEHELIMESSAPVIKRSGGEEIIIGWLRIAYRLDQSFAQRMASQMALDFSIHLQPDGSMGSMLPDSDAFMISSPGFKPLGYHFNERMPEFNLNQSGRIYPHYVHGDDYFTGAVTLPLDSFGLLNIVFALDNSNLSSSLAAFQQTIFWVLLISGLLVIPMGIAFTRRTVTRPINSLVDYAEKVGYGETSVAFKSENISEFNYLGESLQNMVGRLRESKNAIKASETQVRLLLDSAGEGIYGVDENGMVTFANPKALEILGFCTEEFVGQNAHALVHHTHDDGRPYEPQDCPICRSFRGDYPAHIEGELFWRKDGSSLIVEYRAHPIHSGGRVLGSVVTFSDITERKQTENSLELAKNIIENAHEGILVTDLDGVIEQVNDAYVKITGFSREEVLGANPRVLRSGRHDKVFYAEMWKDIYDKGFWEGEIWDRRKNGELFPKWLSIITVQDSLGNPSKYVGIFSDITTLKNAEKELEHLAYYDALTGLPNRVLFLDRLKQGISAAKRDGHQLATLLIDLDRFKYVNDTFGHDAGDALLQIVAQRLQSFLRESDTVARLGGDEFIVLLLETNDPEEASIIAQKIIDDLSAPIEVNGKKVNIGASIGISTYPNDGDQCDLLLKHADLALYKAKDSGRGRYHYFSEELQAAVFDQIAMEEEMLKGIDEGQFSLHYQPKINLTSGKMTGMEALVRWNHPDKGLIRPDHFIPFAEETGLIIPLGQWILRTACRQMAEFNVGLDVPLKVAINISAGQFQQRGLLHILQDTIERYNIEAENIELEITESSVMGDVDEAIAKMNRFRDLGLHLAIDDFGTGYSSLSYLKRFPINTLKIDQSFVRDLTIDSDDAAIVQAIISMAKSLQLNVVAEGVETQEQLAFLKANGCENVQGYLFSKPLPADEFMQYIKDNLV